MDFSICMQFVSIICKCMYKLSPPLCTTTKLQTNTRTNHDISSENSNLSLELLVRKCEKVEVIRIQDKITDIQLNDGMIQVEIDGSFHSFNGSGIVRYVDVVLEFKAPKGEETHSCKILDWDKGVASKVKLVWEILEADQDTNKLVVVFQIHTRLRNMSNNADTYVQRYSALRKIAEVLVFISGHDIVELLTMRIGKRDSNINRSIHDLRRRKEDTGNYYSNKRTGIIDPAVVKELTWNQLLPYRTSGSDGGRELGAEVTSHPENNGNRSHRYVPPGSRAVPILKKEGKGNRSVKCYADTLIPQNGLVRTGIDKNKISEPLGGAVKLSCKSGKNPEVYDWFYT